MHENLGTACVGRVDQSSKIFNPPSPVLKAGASCLYVYAYYANLLNISCPINLIPNITETLGPDFSPSRVEAGLAATCGEDMI